MPHPHPFAGGGAVCDVAQGMHPDSVREYSERACESGGMGHLSGAGFIEEFLEMHAKKPLTSPKSSLTSPKML